MKLDMVALHAISDQFRDGHTEPPQEIVRALAAMIGDTEVVHPVAVRDYTREAEGSEETRTKWDCVALAGGSLVNVWGARAGDWYRDDFNERAGAPTTFGRLIPMSDVVACRLLSLKSFAVTEWVTRWQVELKSGDPVIIPWPSYRNGQERHESLALEVVKRIRSIASAHA